MKRTLVASILGAVASVAMVSSSYGQGQIWFDTYSADGGNGVLTTFGAGVAGHAAGDLLDNSFHAVLYYQFGSATDAAGVADPAAGFTLLSGTTAQYAAGAASPGYFAGPIVTIPGYVSGPVTFEILAYSGADWASSLVRGHSAAFTEPSLATGTVQPAEFSALAPFQVMNVPEPTTLTLAGLGAAAMLIFRRRK